MDGEPGPAEEPTAAAAASADVGEEGGAAAAATAPAAGEATDGGAAAVGDGDGDDVIGDISDDDDDAIGDISDDEEDEGGGKGEGAASGAAADRESAVARVREDPKNRTAAGVFESDEEDAGAAASPQPFIEEEEAAQDIEYSKEFPVSNRPFGKNVSLLKMPNFLSIESTPFHPDTYAEVREDAATGKLDELGRNRVKLSVDNTLRWRYAQDERGEPVVGDDGEYVKESNAKLVRWSDGSETLVLGDTHISVVRKDIRDEGNCLLRLVDYNLEAVAVIGSKMSLKPMSTSSKIHQRLTKTAAMAIEKKKRKIQVFKGTRENPDVQMERLEKTHSAAIAANRRREEKQAAERYRHARAAPMSRDFLEEGMVEDDDDDEEFAFGGRDPYADYEEGAASEGEQEAEEEAVEEKKKPAARQSQRRRIDDDDDDDDDDADDSDGDADDGSKDAEARKRRRVVEDSDEDE